MGHATLGRMLNWYVLLFAHVVNVIPYCVIDFTES